MVRKRKIIVYIATSADGFIARTDGSVDWLDRPSPKGNYGMGAFYKSIDTILWGRKTCDMALDFQKKGVSGSAFDTNVKNYVFTRRPVPSAAPAGVEFQVAVPSGSRFVCECGMSPQVWAEHPPAVEFTIAVAVPAADWRRDFLVPGRAGRRPAMRRKRAPK